MIRIFQSIIRKLIFLYFKYKIRRRFKYFLIHDLPKQESSPSIPIIVIGMHRSGTTLLTSVLEKLGVNMGSLKGFDTEESLPFQCLNDALFSITHSHWDFPTPLVNELEANQEVFSRIFWECLQSWPFLFHNRNFKKLINNSSETVWGWKDPRNTFTLPIWLRLFPEARVVHIYRNGIDVAQSLKTRNFKLPENDDISLRTLKLVGGLILWQEYIEKAFKNLTLLADHNQLNICYENLNQDSNNQIKRLVSFIGLNPNFDEFSVVSSMLDTSRVNSFLKNEELIDLYRKEKDSDIFQKLKYQNII